MSCRCLPGVPAAVARRCVHLDAASAHVCLPRPPFARRYRDSNQARVPYKEIEAYKKRKGGYYPLLAPVFSDTKPNLADMGVGA